MAAGADLGPGRSERRLTAASQHGRRFRGASAVVVVREPWRAHPLAWIHRAEARSLAAELRRAGSAVRIVPFREEAVARLPSGPLLLRLSDPMMLVAATELTRAGIPYIGPSAAAMARCYDKYEAHRIAVAAGVDCPETVLGTADGAIAFPLILKPRRGSDSIGVRLLKTGPLPARARSDRFVVQERVIGSELTIAVIHGRVGKPLQIFMPEGVPYSFLRKYLLRPDRAPLADAGLAARVEHAGLQIAETLAADWAARVDFVHETATGRLRFLECDVAPLIGANSAFAASLAAAGMTRAEQLRLLLDAGGSGVRG